MIDYHPIPLQCTGRISESDTYSGGRVRGRGGRKGDRTPLQCNFREWYLQWWEGGRKEGRKRDRLSSNSSPVCWKNFRECYLQW